MSHLVDECPGRPGSKLRDGGLQRPHSVDDMAVNWMVGTAR